MKKNLFYLFALICSMSLFTSCSDDDDPVYPIEEEIAGTYKGTLDIELAGTSVATGMPKNITIAKVSGNSISLELKDFSLMGTNFGTIKLEKCVLKQNGTSYTFTGSQELNLSGVGKCNVDVAGTINNGKAEVNLDIDVLQLGQEVKVVYKGTKLAGSESSEAKITAFTIDSEFVTEQPVIDEATRAISFKVSDTATDDDLKALKPVVTISEKATVIPASGVAQDFSGGKVVTYAVTAEDGKTVEYTVSISAKGQIYSFENWVAGVEGQKPEMTFYEPVGWASSNTGAHFLKAFGLADSYVVMETDDAHSGEKAALIKSIDTKGRDLWLAKAPKVTTGTLFLGKFITDTGNTLNSTKFGLPYSNKPITLKGWYKYTPGEEFYVCEAPYMQNCHNSTLDETKTDQFAINAVLYTTEEYDLENWSDCLTGVPNDNDNNITESSRVVAIATLSGGAQADWKEFELQFEYKKNFDPQQKYRLSISCSSSKDGDKFWGAPGSTLIVDDLELIVE
ncbi:PCMD domain-containing protein [Bacteroides cellulosilyticus]|jgi:hypothetical protein|uniref:PCMD domain-containing protein n=1 Tax=Bacteroides cellulosilyticus TaxID=246787 RepID=UPI00189F92EC|nr:PCMD domain-containing protein [Bacteroides cellulosilyticus]